ncbi:MAG: zinc-ribbon domain-containing protein [Clostridiales bacterium]|nr:zinc-ribbon domain-containing protein [Clostridiales bacterium]
MAFCSKCGAELEKDAKTCPSCGATVGETSEKKENGSDFGARAEEAFNKFNDTKDDTSAFDPADIESNKVMGILSYLSWLVLIPLIAAPKSPFARFHANQGLILAIIEIAFSIVLGALSLIPGVGIVFNIILSLLGLVFLLFSILGIVNAANGKAKELPVIGKIRLIK